LSPAALLHFFRDAALLHFFRDAALLHFFRDAALHFYKPTTLFVSGVPSLFTCAAITAL
jgi:hypothetical protein